MTNESLNPYYSGSYSLIDRRTAAITECLVGLNPYYSGSYSLICVYWYVLTLTAIVLILIILEVTL